MLDKSKPPRFHHRGFETCSRVGKQRLLATAVGSTKILQDLQKCRPLTCLWYSGALRIWRSHLSWMDIARWEASREAVVGLEDIVKRSCQSPCGRMLEGAVG